MTKLSIFGYIALAASCVSIPQTHYYALVLPPALESYTATRAELTVDELSVASAYDDQRIVYRPGPYRLRYYEYHQWSAPPSLAVSDYLRDALSQSGRFQRVSSERSPATTLVLGGRISSFEEVDVTPTRWVGRVELELFLEDPNSGEVVWSRRFRVQRPLSTRSPAGVAEALSSALAQIVAEATPQIAGVAERARRGDERPAASLSRSP
jgi:ABC-type uncharacterized transport system auxiliary subunit